MELRHKLVLARDVLTRLDDCLVDAGACGKHGLNDLVDVVEFGGLGIELADLRLASAHVGDHGAQLVVEGVKGL